VLRAAAGIDGFNENFVFGHGNAPFLVVWMIVLL
jgi:hypothetical protein